MYGCNINLRRRIGILQTDPEPAAVAPWLVNYCLFAVKLKRNAVVAEPVALNFGNSGN